MTTDESPSDRLQPAPPEQPASQQFTLKTLLIVVAGFAVLFGVLTWLGLRGTGALIAFAAASGGALAAIFCIELFWACRTMLWRQSDATRDAKQERTGDLRNM